MKKMLCLVMIVMMLLTGCQPPFKSPAEDVTVPIETLPVHTEAPVQIPDQTIPKAEPVVYQQQPMYAISMPIMTETVSDNGSVIFQHNYQNMHLMIPDEDIADCIIVDYLNRMDGVTAVVEEFAGNAQIQFSNDDHWMPHYYDVYYNPTRIDSEVLSLWGISSSYTGSRPVQTCSSINYSLLNGDVLTLGSILRHIDSKAMLIGLVIQKAEIIKEEKQLFDDYADYIKERFDKEESFDEDWYFTRTGLSFYFSPYEIAPYSSGIVTLEVPYEELRGIIANEFFPPEKEVLEGQINAQLLSEIDTSSFTQLPKITLNESGESFLLYADGAISDVQIEIGTWNEDGSVFFPTSTVFAAVSITPGDGIIVQAFIPDTMPSIRITYANGAETTSVFLSQSGIDGSAVLIPE